MAFQVSFVMHPDDERLFLGGLVQTARWIVALDRNAVAWQPLDPDEISSNGPEIVHLARPEWLGSSSMPTERVQFWRSRLSETVLTQGRLAVSLPDIEANMREESGAKAEVSRMGKQLRHSYVNRILAWRQDGATNEVEVPDARTWVGPSARSWLGLDRDRCVKQFHEARVSGWLVSAAG